MRFLVTVDPGLEGIAAGEIAEKLPGATVDIRPYGVAGHLLVETLGIESLLDLGTIHHIIEIRGEAAAGPLQDIPKALETIEFPELAASPSFRVTSKLVGDYAFDKQDLQRAAGAVLHERHRTPVDLEKPALNIRIDLYAGRLVAGIQRTGESIGNRIKRAKPLRSSIKPTIAAAMLRLAGAHRGGGSLIDPMCGAGTIPIEAARINPGLKVQASDWDEATVEIARATIAAHGMDIGVTVADARALGELLPGRYDYIVTNPPYGIRQARRTSIARLYRSLLPSFAAAIKSSGTIAMIVVKYRVFLSALEGSPLRVVDELVVHLGNLDARLFRLKLRSAQAPSGPREWEPHTKKP